MIESVREKERGRERGRPYIWYILAETLMMQKINLQIFIFIISYRNWKYLIIMNQYFKAEGEFQFKFWPVWIVKIFLSNGFPSSTVFGLLLRRFSRRHFHTYTLRRAGEKTRFMFWCPSRNRYMNVRTWKLNITDERNKQCQINHFIISFIIHNLHTINMEME